MLAVNDTGVTQAVADYGLRSMPIDIAGEGGSARSLRFPALNPCQPKQG
jgi:hypothetical protein